MWSLSSGPRQPPTTPTPRPLHTSPPHRPPAWCPSQGTNAHAIVEVMDKPCLPISRCSTAAWQRLQFWVTPPPHPLLISFLPAHLISGPKQLSHLICLQLRPFSLPAACSMQLGTGGGISLTWAAALEAVYAASPILSAVYDGKQQEGQVGLAHAVFSSSIAASIGHVAQVCVDLRSSSVDLMQQRLGTRQGERVVGGQFVHAAAQAKITMPPEQGWHKAVLALINTSLPQLDAGRRVAATAQIDTGPADRAMLFPPASLEASSQLSALQQHARSSSPEALDMAICKGSDPGQQLSWRRYLVADVHSACSVSSNLGGSGSVVTGLQLDAPELGAEAARLAAAVQPVDAKEMHMNYVTSWQAYAPSVHLLNGGAAGPLHIKQTCFSVLGRAGKLEVTNRSKDGAEACMAAMQVAQVAAGGMGTSLHLKVASLATTPTQPAASAQGAHVAAMFGMLRCVASELPSMEVLACSMDARLYPPYSWGLQWERGHGHHGQLHSSGTHFVPRLLRAISSPGVACFCGSSLPSSWAVTGGTGSIGMLAAQWIVGGGPCRVLLLGRTGRMVAEESASTFLLGSGSYIQLTM